MDAKRWASLFFFTAAVVLTGCLQTRTGTSPSNPSITATIDFTTTTLSGPVSKDQLASCWTTKLKIGSSENDAYEFLTLSTNGQDKRIRVETCQQYTNAIHQGAFAFTTFDMTMQGWFQRAAGTLQFIESATPSTHPLPDSFLSHLPVSLLGWHGSDAEAQIKQDTRKGITLKDYARSGKVKNLKRERHQIRFQTEGQDFGIEELARGDVDGDGFEDALVFVTWHYREGSGRGYELQVWSRNKLRPFPPDW